MYHNHECLHCRYVSTDEMEQCKPQCKASTNQRVSSTPGLYSSLKTRGGSAPLLFRLGGQLPPPSPPGSYASATKTNFIVTQFVVKCYSNYDTQHGHNNCSSLLDWVVDEILAFIHRISVHMEFLL